MNNDADAEHGPERIKQKKRGMGGWAFLMEIYILIPPNIPTQATHPLSVSRKRTSNEWPWVSWENRSPPDRATQIYNLEYIKQCESHVFCHILALNQLPLGTLASLNSILSKLAIVPWIAD